MKHLKEILAQKIELKRSQLKDILKNHGQDIVDTVSLQQVFQGMRGVKGILWEPSLLDANEGIRFRGYTIPEIKEKLPHAKGGTQPLPEGLFYLMLTGDIPSQAEVEAISNDWAARNVIPPHVCKVIDAFPETAHPMTLFSAAVMSLQPSSVFSKAYAEGNISKPDYWKTTYEDAVTLIACLPSIAAYIYNKKYHKDGSTSVQKVEGADWSANFGYMIGKESYIFQDFMRMYFSIHADHEGGNVSAHTSRLVGSALSDPYLCFAASMNGLAGPLHGLANQEVIKWIIDLQSSLKTNTPTNEQIKKYIAQTLSAGKVLPGYGHAVLRKTDPRYTALMEFAKEHITNDHTIEIIWKIYEVAPDMLASLGKVKNPWPNVDAHSGGILVHYGLTQYEFYTVLFGVSRALGVMASLIWDRALALPIERPKSTTLHEVNSWIQGK